ncbi:MAG: T9SS type A sorting domain-containing protein [Chitinophagales bacterium]|nr:T9SS type A sorting domain-containing protein [Chitinophagales bacterium]MDW8428826.1 T9SS type A sorting domain-containing protein [Chitinophagales bacterium]
METHSLALQKLLSRYTAIAAGTLLSAPAAAQVIYQDIDPDIVLEIGQSAALDLNGDGITDFKFRVTTYGTGWYFVGLAPQPPLLTNVNAFAGYTLDLGATPSIYAFPLQLDFGQVIDDNLPWITLADMAWVSSNILYYFYAGMVSNYYGNILGQWSNATDKFLGLRFSLNGINMHYAWVRCDVNTDGTQLVLKDYAYNASADLPIVAGWATSDVNKDLKGACTLWRSSEKLYVQLSSGFKAPAALQVYDLWGRLSIQKILSQQITELVLTRLSAGVYVARVVDAEGAVLAHLKFSR